MTIRDMVISLGCWLLLLGSVLAGEPIISDVPLDIKVLKKSVESLEDAEALTKKITRLSDRHDKAPTAEKKAAVLEDLEELKIELVMMDGFADAWRNILAKALKIKDEQLKNDYPSVEEIKELTDKELSRLMDKHYPLTKRTELEKQAILRFPTNGVGDSITVSVNGRTISGRVNSMTTAGAMIGSTMVPLSDLPPSFHVKRMLTNRQDYVRENYTEKRLAYLKKVREKLPAKVYRESGYINYEGSWMPAMDVTKRIEERISELKTVGEENYAKKQALIASAKKYGTMAAGGFGVLLVLGILVAVKARKN